MNDLDLVIGRFYHRVTPINSESPGLKWRFPKMGLPPNHTFKIKKIWHYKPSSYWGSPIFLETTWGGQEKHGYEVPLKQRALYHWLHLIRDLHVC